MRALLLPGPFFLDPEWSAGGYAPLTVPTVPTAGPPARTTATVALTCTNRSGHGTRSHSPAREKLPPLQHVSTVIGDYGRFIDTIVGCLGRAGLDVTGTGTGSAGDRAYEMDHLCFRCETEVVVTYLSVCDAW